MKSFSEPINSEVDAAMALLLSSPVHATYFFDRLENPNWIKPLKTRDFFASPPAPERTEGGGVRYPIWPASKFLTRMAANAPEEVGEILRGIETENHSVIREMLDAALRMPAAIAATLVPNVGRAFNAGARTLLFPKAIDLCVQLATGGQVGAAMDLAESIFLPLFEQDRDRPGHEDEYWYAEGLKKVIPMFASEAPVRFLTDVCEWLKASIMANEYFGKHPPSDHSDHWRPAIEEHGQNGIGDFECGLVGFVRQGFEQAIENRHIEIEAALTILAGHEYWVFTRLRVHLIKQFAEQAPGLAQATMMDPEMFKASQLWLWHEYAMLMRRCFSMLLPDEQAVWLGWVDTGPNTREFWWNRDVAGREANDEDRREWVESWQAVRFHWIAEHLSGERRTFYEKKSAKLDDPESLDFHYFSPPADIGWRSPISAEELNGLNLPDALNKISAWRLSKRQTNLIGEGREALAIAFGQYVGANAEALSAQAIALERLNPDPIYIYVRTFIEQMAEAVKLGRKIDLAAVLRLCNWVVERPLAGYGNYIPIDGVLWKLDDRDWQWARDAICRLIREVCALASDGVPRYPLRGNQEAICSLLKPLAQDPDKSHLAVEAAGKNLTAYDFLTAAINTPRGIALEAVIAYARWYSNQIAQEADGRKTVPGGFGTMPEVRERLEWQIKPENASFEAFAVIGAHLSLLHWIDETWATTNAERIFDLIAIEQEPGSAFGWAAWNSFLEWGQIHASYFRILRPQYYYAVRHVSKAVLKANSGRTPIHRLGEHLVVLYGRGNLKTSSSDDEKLLFDFLKAADGDVRSQTIAFVGSTLRQNKAVSEAIIARFEKLWDWYWPAFGENDVVARPVSGLFASWFNFDQFPVAWRLDRLEAVVALSQIPDLAEQVVERLAKIVVTNAEHITIVTRILDQMIRADNDGWRAYAWREPAMTILGLAVRADEVTKNVAHKLIDDLGRRGYHEFGKLLRQGDVAKDRI